MEYSIQYKGQSVPPTQLPQELLLASKVVKILATKVAWFEGLQYLAYLENYYFLRSEKKSHCRKKLFAHLSSIFIKTP